MKINQMRTLDVANITHTERIKSRSNEIIEVLNNFSYRFLFGQSYLLNAPLGMGSELLTKIISGVVRPNKGKVLLDGEDFAAENRRKASWLVRQDEIKRWGVLSQSVEKQIRFGLQNTINQFSSFEKDFLQAFHLSPERYTRPLRQFSSEGWRASSAIGLANGKQIFCFPHLETVPYLIQDHRSWLEEMLSLLASTGVLILIPSQLNSVIQDLCDEVVHV